MAKPELQRVNMNLPVDLVSKIDEYAEELCLNRTSAITVLLSTALQQNKTLSTFEDMMNLFKLESVKLGLSDSKETPARTD